MVTLVILWLLRVILSIYQYRPLSIDSATGDVTLSVNPDFESVPSYSFDVVSNGGAQSGSATANVVNISEQAPVFESAVAADAIAENSGAGQVVYTAQADDSADASAAFIAWLALMPQHLALILLALWL